jgi:tripartite-type tricarboxylate transporter receptor subunit TctC
MQDNSQPRPLVTRRTLLAGAGGIAAAGLGAFPAAGQDTYPNRPVRIIIGFGPGGLADISMRIIADKLGDRLGKRVFIENKPGAGGILGAQAGAISPPDGYTLVVLTISTTIAVSLLKSTPFDVSRDFVPISTVAFFDLVLVANAGAPYKTLGEFLAEARQRGPSMNIGTIAPGSVQNLTAELFKVAAGLKSTIVTHRTTPEVQMSLTRNDVALVSESYAALQGPIEAGQFRVLATTGRARTLPDVPTVREAGLPDAEVEGWNALFAPANTPPEIAQLLNRHVVDIIAQPEVNKRILDLRTEPRASTQAELAELIRSDIRKWADVIDRAHIERR